MWQKHKLQHFEGALFKKLIALIESYIEQGVLVLGEKLPSERQLAELLQINRSTVVHALDELTQRGVLIRKMGSGTFINPHKWGVQAHPTINWYLPSYFLRRDSLYQQKIQQLKQQALNNGKAICDLANGDLPATLIPQLNLPQMSSQELIYQEQSSDRLLMGLPTLKQQIANYMQHKFAMKVSTDEILITSGTQQALFLITQGLLKPGDAIGIETPSYFYSLPLFQAAGIRIYGINMDRDGIMLDELAQVQQKHGLKWLLLNPIFQNPTGITMSATRKSEVLAFCRREGIGIVEDDAYSALAFTHELDCSPIKKLDQYNQVIYLGSLSKYLGRSIRVGWMIGPSQVIRRLAEIRQYIDSGLSILPQLLAENYLQHHYHDHQRYLCQQLHAKQREFMSWLTQYYPNCTINPISQGGMHLYCQLDVKNIKQQEFFLNHWLAKGITVAKGDLFGGNIENIRLSYGHFHKKLV